MDGQFMFRTTLWLVVWLGVSLAGCRSFSPVGRASVRTGVSTAKSSGGASAASGSFWHNPDTAVQPASATVGQDLDEVIPTATSEARTAWGRPDLGSIYSRTAQADDLQRNPIIVIPGILGSKLVDESERRVAWGEFGGNGIDPASPDGARLLALPIENGKSLEELSDTVKVAGALDALNVRVFGVPFQIAAYRDILGALGVGGYRDAETNLGNIDYGKQHYNCFQFAYDWRRDNVETAAQLHEFILEKKAYVEAERRKRYGDSAEPVRFDIVAHSMGGVMARYYLQYGNASLPEDGSPPDLTWAGAKYVDRLVMVAPPNAGSLQAVEYLTQGVQFSRFFSKYEPALLGTMPSIYQLLPRTRHRPVVAGAQRVAVDLYDPDTWVQAHWGFFNPSQAELLRHLLPHEPDPHQRQKIAYEHLSKCLRRAEAFHASIDVKSYPPTGTSIHLIASDAHPTMFQYLVDGRGGLTPTARVAGDGIVTRHSALMDERLANRSNWAPRLQSPVKWESVTFLFTDHLGLTKDPAFTDNVLYLLLESPR
jgi:pimeloyl-ACP methyl ester carboxylesterase